jgi:type I restriction enzyme S subunit
MGIKIDMTAKDLKVLSAILQQYLPDTVVWAFGSRVKFTSKSYSDLDLAAFINEEQKMKFSLLKDALAESNLPFRIDLHNWNDIPDTFKKNIEADYVILQDSKKKELPEGWKTYKLGEIGKIITGKTPPTANTVFFGKEYPFVTPKDMIGQKMIDKTERYLSQEGGKLLKNIVLPPNSICVSCIGSDLGKVVMTKEYSFTNQQLNSIICENQFNPGFIFYSCILLSEQLQVLGKTSTAVPIVNKSTFSNFEIRVPDLSTQRKIAQILTSLDDKIELNLQMNQTLEAMAQAIFKEWFVDFNFPGFDGELVDGLPKGWRKGNVLEIATLLSGGTPKTDVSEFWNGDINWISAKDITNINGQFILETEKTITELGIDKSAAKLLPQNTIIVSARGTVGNYCILSKEMAISQSNYGLKSNRNADFFLFLQIENMIEMMKAYSYGTVFDTITTKTFQEMEIIIPSNEVMASFEGYVTPFYVKMLENQKQIQILTQVRDGLLPKLMSGKIKIES